ncbi:hypothetical protein QTO34_009771 [Cnephaeus nilssonii]|uniref:Uncharacterized protein n=1 Tax=Cnephaeus nilssonii TaxID=3371016 RepID=A0AA40HE42_CNENI|nr:hypothetical protein QTO34_009771 [Eptesicus nilssonii]
MDAPRRSFTFLLLFLMGWPLRECLPYAGDRKDDTPEPAKKDVSARSLAPSPSAREAAPSPRRRALVRVVTIACTALSVALVCGVAASYVIYRLGQDEEREQLAALSENIKMPLSETRRRPCRPGARAGLVTCFRGARRSWPRSSTQVGIPPLRQIQSHRRAELAMTAQFLFFV